MSFGGGNSALLDFQIATQNMFGMAQYGASQDEAALLRQQAGLASDQAEAAAIQKEREVRQFAEHQAVTYNQNGVLLDGSPLAVVEETRRLGAQEVSAIRTAGQYQMNELLLEANQTERAGLQSLLGSQAKGTTDRLQYQEQQRQQRWQLFGGIVRGAASLGSQLMGAF